MKATQVSNDPKVITMPICFPPQMLADLDAQAQREGLYRGRSAIVRRAVAEYLDKYGRAGKTQEAGR